MTNLRRRPTLIAHIQRRPRIQKQAVAVAIDVMLCMAAVSIAYYLRLGVWVYPRSTQFLSLLLAVLMAIPVLWAFGLYQTLFRHVSTASLTRLVQACVLYGSLYAALFTYLGVGGVPRTVGLIQPVVMGILLAGWRITASGLLSGKARDWIMGLSGDRGRTRALIYGAGTAGRQLSKALADSRDMKVVGFIDDDPAMHRRYLDGYLIHPARDLPALVSSLAVKDILLAIPSSSRRRRNDIVESLRGTSARIHTLPAMSDIASGRIKISDLRDLEIEDLLGRDTVAPDYALMAPKISGKVVLVTGAGGSIGSELCRQIIPLHPMCLLLLDSSEFNLYSIHTELSRKLCATTGVDLVPLIGSVTDAARMADICAAWKPATIYHAAAYKHVPLVEYNAVEGLRNNAIGTAIIARAAADSGVADFVLVSTDKAVRPTNVMGTSKRLAEMILQSFAADSSNRGNTRFSMVRFGNVLGSSGSVVPLFRQQIQSGGPITVTDRRMTRYFMTIPEAAQLVIQAGGMAQGGEVFVLDMGEPVEIVHLARKMIELSGLTERTEDRPDGDLEITEVGLRPGEKLYEELLIGENPEPTGHQRIMKANEHFLPWEQLQPMLALLRAAMDKGEATAIRSLLLQIVPEYNPTGEPMDWVERERRRKETCKLEN